MYICDIYIKTSKHIKLKQLTRPTDPSKILKAVQWVEKPVHNQASRRGHRNYCKLWNYFNGSAWPIRTQILLGGVNWLVLETQLLSSCQGVERTASG